jgi:hypothetical protein
MSSNLASLIFDSYEPGLFPLRSLTLVLAVLLPRLLLFSIIPSLEMLLLSVYCYQHRDS